MPLTYPPQVAIGPPSQAQLTTLLNGTYPTINNGGTPWLIDINVFMTSIAQTGWDALGFAVNTVYYSHKESDGAQNRTIAWDIVLAAGTWTIELMHSPNVDRGIYTVKLDATTVGTIDGYAAALSQNARTAVTGIVVATTGKSRLSLTMATKNAASSSYYGAIQHVQLRRTA